MKTEQLSRVSLQKMIATQWKMENPAWQELFAKPDQDLVLVGFPGLAGTGILAQVKEDELKQWFSKPFLEEAYQCLEMSRFIPEDITAGCDVSAVQIVLEGGIYRALWELAKKAGIGLEISIEDIVIKQPTIELCEKYDLNPYQLLSGGCILIATNQGRKLADTLQRREIQARIIGHTTASREKLIYRQGKAGNLEASRHDELYKIC